MACNVISAESEENKSLFPSVLHTSVRVCKAFVVISGGTEKELQGLLVHSPPMLWRADNCFMARRL